MKKSTPYFALFLLCLTFHHLHAQDTAAYRRTVGLSASIQQSGEAIQVPIWINNRGTLAPFVAFHTEEGLGSDLTYGLSARFFLNSKKLMPYIGFRIGVAVLYAHTYTPPGKEPAKKPVDGLGTLAFGGEYFFDPRFSLGVEAQGNFIFSDLNSKRVSNPGGTNFNTAMAIIANVYFGK